MLELAWPWFLIASALPLLVARLAPPAIPRAGGALRVPFYQASQGWEPPGTSRMPRTATALAILAWLFLVLAAARPQWVGEPLGLPVTGRDLLLAVDLSGSMKTRDMTEAGERVARLEVVKRVAREFIDRRDGDRVGLILFGTRAYLQAPLTFDLGAVGTLLGQAVLGLAGEQTAIGDAIGLGVKRLRERPADNRVLVLLTDGANTAGEIEPLQAARLAAADGLRIYTIGVGADELMVRSLLGTQRVNPSADLDEETLSAIATMTGGRYFRARDTDELENIYRLIDGLEPAARGEALLRPRTELFHWPLAAATVISLGLALGLLLPPWRTVAARPAPGGVAGRE